MDHVSVPSLLVHESLLPPHLNLPDVLLQDVDLGGELHIVRLHYAVSLVCSCLVFREESHLVLELLDLVVEFYHVLLNADVTVNVGLVTVGAAAAGVEAAGGWARVVESRGQGCRAPLLGTTEISTLTDRCNY